MVATSNFTRRIMRQVAIHEGVCEADGVKASRAGISIEVMVALGNAAEKHIALYDGQCPHNIGLVLADALAPYWPGGRTNG